MDTTSAKWRAAFDFGADGAQLRTGEALEHEQSGERSLEEEQHRRQQQQRAPGVQRQDEAVGPIRTSNQ